MSTVLGECDGGLAAGPFDSCEDAEDYVDVYAAWFERSLAELQARWGR